MREERARAENLIAKVAARQYGVITAEQLRGIGLGRTAISRRVERGRLHRLHRGVYAVGHPAVSREGRWLAAVLACGKKAVLSHISAAALWGLLSLPGGEVAHVTVAGDGGRRRRRMIRVHRSTALAQNEVTRRRNIPVTTPSRTLLDLRRTIPRKRFADAVRQAEVLGLAVDSVLGPDGTRSELEARFLAICRRHRLPRPMVNTRIGPHLVDFTWPGTRLVIELDGYRFHRGRAAFEQDRARDLALKGLGYEVLRLTWRQLDDGAAIASAVRAALRGS